MKRYIIRQVPPEHVDVSFYFDCDCFSEASGDYNNTLFILYCDRFRYYGENIEEYTRIYKRINSMISDYDNIETDYMFRHTSLGELLRDYQLIESIKNTHGIRKWRAFLDRVSNARDIELEHVAEYLTLATGKQWAIDDAHGYCQGDYVQIIYCSDQYPKGVQYIGEIWLGACQEYSIVFLNDDGEETDEVFGYYIADCQWRHPEDIKSLICEWGDIPEDETTLETISGQRTVTHYEYTEVV